MECQTSELMFLSSSKHSSGCGPCQACVSAAHCCLTCAPSLNQNCHSLICHSVFLNSVGTRGISLTFKSRKGGKKHHFTNFTVSVGSRAFSARFCWFHWPKLVRSHTHHPCLHPCKPQNLSFSVALRVQIMSSAQQSRLREPDKTANAFHPAKAVLPEC